MPTPLLYTIGVLVFALGLLLSIALHEVGHMVPAKKFGVKVTQYMVGFGPTLWSRKRGDTEYGVKAIPLGGYIRMIGMVPPPRTDGKRSRWPRRLATAVEDFRQISRAEVDPQDENREFYRLTPGKKMIVMLGGPCMNLLIFLVLTIILLTAIGVQHATTTTTVGGVENCLVPANSAAARTGVCPAHAKHPPAYGVLERHDQFVSIDGTAIHDWSQVVAAIQPAAGRQLTIVVRRDGHLVTLHVTPARNLNYVGTGDHLREVGFLGFTPHEHMYFQPVSVTALPGAIGSQLREAVDAIGSYPAKVGNLWDVVFDNAPRDQNGAVGVVGIGRLSGDFAASKSFTGEEKILTLVGLLASVNLLLFFFNLLPLLPLDGGHVLGALVESAKRGRQRLRHRSHPRLGPDGRPVPRQPIFVDTAQMLPVMYAVGSVLVLLTLLTLYADIVKPITPAGG